MVYLLKNPGANLTPPGVFAVGTSNEKKFVIKQWTYMAMRNQDGNPPYHWEGWIKIPKRYQRMGTDDIWQIVSGINSETGHMYLNAIYKEYFQSRILDLNTLIVIKKSLEHEKFYF